MASSSLSGLQPTSFHGTGFIVGNNTFCSQQRTHLILWLRSLSIKPPLLLLLYRCIMESSLLHCATCSLTILSLNSKNKIVKITCTCSKNFGLPTLPSLPVLFNKALLINHD
ncbi:hypothetical protein GOODEAATRI_016660 [Goodea atripinnis]|uniref:Uncharacterized protein n=1 Tax=Goodea atripinnis TaxID=208336 RepID=A0ABV0N575_9TELE